MVFYKLQNPILLAGDLTYHAAIEGRGAHIGKPDKVCRIGNPSKHLSLQLQYLEQA